MRDCPYCRGTGTQYVESGSSLCYDCPDCNGTGSIPTCDCCGNDYYGEYCEDCYTVCDTCRVIKSTDDEMADTFICNDCLDNAQEVARVLSGIGISTHDTSIYDLADIHYEAYEEVRGHSNSLVKAGDVGLSPEDWQLRYRKNLHDIATSERYYCRPYIAVKCGFCGEFGVDVEYLGSEQDSDGVFENWVATCTHCGRRSVDMDDPGSAVGIIARGDKGEVVDAD